MKKVLIILALACGISHAAMSQQPTYKVEGNTYKAVKTNIPPKRDSTITAYTYETNGKAYAIYLSKNGSAYVGRVSSRTGRYYRQYLGEAISRDICGKTGKEYKGKGKISK